MSAPTIAIQDLWTRFLPRRSDEADPPVSVGGDPAWVHRGVCLDVQRGESLCIIGGSGAGKSVLLRTLIGLHPPARGEVCIDGVNVARAGRAELYGLMSRVGVLFQFGALFDSLPVWANVTFGLRERGMARDGTEAERRDLAREKLRMVGLRGCEDKYPGQLSGGMAKRVGLARAIAHDPEILLCDEPTSGLDPVMSATVSELIVQMKERLDVTAITITHDMRSAFKIGDRIAMLYEGRVRACDTPDAIRDSADPVVRQFVQGRALGPMSIPGEEP